MEYLFPIIILALVVLSIWLLIYTLLDAVKLKDDMTKIVWILIIIMAAPIGSIVYLIAKPRQNGK